MRRRLSESEEEYRKAITDFESSYQDTTNGMIEMLKNNMLSVEIDDTGETALDMFYVENTDPNIQIPQELAIKEEEKKN